MAKQALVSDLVKDASGAGSAHRPGRAGPQRCGGGGLDPATSFAWLWAALERDMTENGLWEIHFVTRQRTLADLIVAKLSDAGIIAEAPR